MKQDKGKVIVLNGAPRSGKSSVAAEIQKTFEGIWINIGVDAYMKMIPAQFQPGIGLRPGGERPDLEPIVKTLFETLYRSIAAHSKAGIHVVADLGHHDVYSSPLHILPRCAKILEEIPVLFVGVKCPVDEIMRRRAATNYLAYAEDGSVPPPVLLWQKAVHEPGVYDLEIDTSLLSPQESARLIHSRLCESNFTAFRSLAETL